MYSMTAAAEPVAEKNQKRIKAVAVDVYNQTIDGDIACAVTAAVGGTNTSGAKVLCVYAQD